jgi:hypothetical protein
VNLSDDSAVELDYDNDDDDDDDDNNNNNVRALNHCLTRKSKRIINVNVSRAVLKTT